MHKIYYILIGIFFLSKSVSSAKATMAIDSIGIENNNGKKVILHRVEAKETYYAIAKRYNVSYKDLMEYNDGKVLQLGMTLKVPTNLPFTTVANSIKKYTEIISYTIKAKDNLNILAQKHGTSVDEIKQLNNLSSINLQIGQVLKIPSSSNVITAETIKPTQAITPTSPTNSSNKTEAIGTHTVQAKESLNLIAKQYHTTAEEIKRLNNLNSINLQIGQVLKVSTNSTIIETSKIVEEPKPIDLSNKNATQTEVTGTHKVKAKESLNVIAKQYNTTVEEIKRLNGLTSNNLQIGQVLKVGGGNTTQTDVVIEKLTTPNTKSYQKPTDEKALSSTVSKTNEASFEHVVAAGETIYAIAKKYNLTTYQLKTFNNLTSEEVTVGQKLIIKGAMPKTLNEEEGDEPEPTASTTSIKDPKLKYAASRYGLTQVEEKGAAVWIEDPDLDAAKMLVLHRTASIGTVIKITNPMTNRSTFAKVVGKFTENETTKDVIIVITKAVADAVGALDKRFFCNINYGAQENEQL
jgi:peptidoglycan endopeptidase LytF